MSTLSKCDHCGTIIDSTYYLVFIAATEHKDFMTASSKPKESKCDLCLDCYQKFEKFFGVVDE